MNKEKNKKTGALGEKIAFKFLVEKGYKILEKNYSKKFGEIDIIGQKNNVLYFFEVKTNTFNPNYKSRPEERVDGRKLHQIGKTVRVYLEEKNKLESEWKFVVIAIIFDPEEKTARLRLIEDVVPE